MDERFKRALRKANYSLTTPRLVVFEYLAKHGPSRPAVMIKSIKHSDRASLYRTIKLFKQLGLTSEVGTGSQTRLELSELFDHHHHHLTCLDCGRTSVITDASLERRIGQISRQSGFEPASHQIEIRGYCHKCRR